MGKEERERKKAEKVGAFNVVITATYPDGKSESFKCKQWIPQGGFINMVLADEEHIMVLPFANVRHFKVRKQTQQELDNEEEQYIE